MRHFILKIHQFIRGWYVLICASWNWCLLQHFFITVHSWSCNTNSYKESCKMTFVCICFVSVTSGGFVMFWVFSPKGSGWWFTAEFICFHDFQSISVSAVHACRHLKAQCLNVSVSVSCMSPRLVSVCNSSFWWVRNRLIKLLMDVMLLDVCMLNGELRSGEVFICSEVLLSEAFWLHHLFRTFFSASVLEVGLSNAFYLWSMSAVLPVGPFEADEFLSVQMKKCFPSECAQTPAAAAAAVCFVMACWASATSQSLRRLPDPIFLSEVW